MVAVAVALDSEAAAVMEMPRLRNTKHHRTLPSIDACDFCAPPTVLPLVSRVTLYIVGT